MNTHGTNRSVPTAQQIKQLGILLGFIFEVVTRIVTRFFFGLSPDEAKALMQNKGALSKKLKVALTEVFVADADPYVAQREYWENFYQKYLGLTADFNLVPIPERPTDGEWRLIFILKGLMMNPTAEALRELLVTYDHEWMLGRYADDLDATIPHNIRTSVESYAIWVRVGRESDEEFRGQSTRQADPDQLIGETFLEHLVHRMVYLVETRQHLDQEGITLCSGSRGADADVPCARWYSGFRQVDVNWINLDSSFQKVGVRRVVSLPKAP